MHILLIIRILTVYLTFIRRYAKNEIQCSKICKLPVITTFSSTEPFGISIL